MLDYINIKGYKSIKEIHLPLRPINILIGSNGSGKSNFISFFNFLSALKDKNLRTYIALQGGEEKILHKGSDFTQKVDFELSFDEKTNGYRVGIELGNEGFVITEERLVYKGDYRADISLNAFEANIKSTDNFRAKYVLRYLNSYMRYHFHDTGKHSPFTQMSNIEDDIYYLYEDGRNLAAYLYLINKNEKKAYQRIIQTIQSIAPYFLDFFFQPNENGHLRLQWKSTFASTLYGASDLSDGTMRFIALATLFMQPTLPATIVIDEPELGLHPVAVAKLAGMVKSAAQKGTQVIMATQSADLISHFEPDDIVTVDLVQGESAFSRLSSQDLTQWLETYSLGDLWQKGIVSTGQPNR